MPNEPTVSLDAAMIETAIQPTLSLRDITKHYAAIAALTDVSFDVLPGEVHALLGENGAGKSTLMNVASGATDARQRNDQPRRRARRAPHAGDRAGPRASRSSTSILRSCPT